ncbi:MAG: DUF4111 domain-containing protein [Armatimonadetes bacterium]|nr:DUF4111 domain-containing protein [Armatimonadota bacterium]
MPKLMIDYPTLNTLLTHLLEGAKEVLGSNFAGLYLHGSLATGDFNTETSDIDFVVATRKNISAVTFDALRSLHYQLANTENQYAKRLEGCYIPLSRLRRYDPQNCTFPCVEVGGVFRMGEQIDTLQLYVLREQSVIVEGDDLRQVIAPISEEEVRQSSQATLEEWWKPQLEDTHRLERADYQVYAVLTMCRILYTQQYARITSKHKAGLWAIETLASEWEPLLSEALHWRPKNEFHHLEETLALIRYTLAWV